MVPLTDIVNRWRYGYPFAAVRPIDLVDTISPRPLFIIHGEADALIPVSHARQLFERATEPKRLWILPGVRHCGAYFEDRSTYVQRVSEFFEAAFSHQAPIEPAAAGPPV